MPLPAPEVLHPLPITPSAEVWRAMSRQARERHVEEVILALQAQAEAMAEGRPHFRAKVGAVTTLGDHFERIGKRIYLASELPVLYPDEPPFAPDLMAVLDVADPGDDDLRMCWSVAEEGRGLDLVLEIHYAGDKDKDLVSNLARYARLGVPEYFVYDRRAQRLYGYRLGPNRQYQSLPIRGGLCHSSVLDLNLRVLDGRLRFYAGAALVPETRELLARLEGIMDQREQDIAEMERQIAEETAARVDLAQRLADREQRLADAEARAAALEQELAALRARLGEGS